MEAAIIYFALAQVPVLAGTNLPMWPRSLPALLVIALAACPAGGGELGDACDGRETCASALQCVASVCVPRCQRAPECGDGFTCSADGLCLRAEGQPGDACTSEVDCAPGLACQIDGPGAPGAVRASCAEHAGGRPAGASCAIDDDCRNGTCALGLCSDLCRETRDCIPGAACMTIPLINDVSSTATGHELYGGCLPARGTVTWTIPVSSPVEDIRIPIPDAARSATIVFRVDDPAQIVGADQVVSPLDDPASPTYPSYSRPCVPTSPTDPVCNAQLARTRYFSQRLRHLPGPGQSVLQLPPSPEVPLETGAYRVRVSSFRANGAQGSAIPSVTAVVKMDSGVTLDLHFHFLDLADHPCASAFGDTRLDAAHAQTATFFQDVFLGELRTMFSRGGIVLGTTTYTDITDHPELDGLAREDAGALLALGTHAQGIDVFFVRSLSPAGLQAFGPSPGPAGLPGTSQSGVVISLDTLCHRSWNQVARLTAHELAGYMGLYNNVELETERFPSWRDPIADSDGTSTNLMYFSEAAGRTLSPGQREVLTRSAVLR